MRKVDDGEKKEKKKKKEKNGVFSGHYVIASSLPPERLRPNDNHWNAARSCQCIVFLERRELLLEHIIYFVADLYSTLDLNKFLFTRYLVNVICFILILAAIVSLWNYCMW